jgi:hypothetical protein
MYGSLQKLAQLRRGLELRDRVQFFECGRERIRKTSDGPRTEFLVLRLEIQIMNGSGEMLWCLRFAFDESLVDDNFCCIAATSVISLRCHSSTCLRIGSKFRCILSTPTEMQSMSEKASSV